MTKAAAVEKTAEATQAGDPQDSQAAELEAARSRIAELEALQKSDDRVIDYVIPQATETQKDRSNIGGEAPCRVVKTTPVNPKHRFDIIAGEDGNPVKQLRMGQFRIPLSGKKFDLLRMEMELRENGQDLVENICPEIPHYCELNNCWNPARYDGSFCSKGHADLALGAHDRFVSFE